jgi:hypothetical protein
MMQDMIKRRCVWLLMALVLAAGVATPAVAAVRADVDRDQVYVGDTVTLVIESNDPAVGDPDLSALQQDFEILGTGTSSSFSMVNGRSSSLRSWRVRLRPRRLGELEIPALRLAGEQTRALSITVSDVPALSAASGEAPAIVELSVDVSGPVYVQQQVPLTLRLYQDQRVLEGTLEPLRVADAVVQPLGLERRYSVTRNGRQYRVSERRYALAPERRGRLEIPALDFRGKLAPPQPGSGGVQPFRVSSDPQMIDVQPPATTGDYWLPAQQLTLRDSWADQAPTLRRGEPVDRVITLQATGLNGAQLPILQPTSPTGARVYPGRQVNDTRSDSTNLYGISRQTFTYVPGDAGTLEIPPVTVDWWNTSTQQLEAAGLAAMTLQVLPGAAGRDAADRHLAEAPSADPAASGSGAGGLPGWLWLLIGAGVLVGLYRFRDGLVDRWGAMTQRVRMPHRTAAASSSAPVAAPLRAPHADDRPVAEPVARSQLPGTDGVGQQRSRLEAACRKGDAQAAALALLDLGRARWPEAPPTNLRDLADRLQRGKREIDALDRALYGSARQAWDGVALWSAIGGFNWQVDRSIADRSEGSTLPPLYPHEV